MMIDWDDPAIAAILACRDNGHAWKLLVAYLEPVRDKIWAKRREGLPKRGGRRSAGQRTAANRALAEAVAKAASLRAEVEMEIMRPLRGRMSQPRMLARRAGRKR